MGIIIFLLIIAAILGGFASVIILLIHKRWKAAIGVFAVVTVLFLCFPEGKFYPYPLIDTIRAKEFTITGLSQVKSGMSKEQVYQLIGKPVIAESYRVPITPGDKGWLNPTEFGYCEVHTTDGKLKYWDFAWYHAEVCYRENNTVYNTTGFWQED